MGFDMADRLALGKLVITPESAMGTLRINDWFGPHFFTTNFWYMWATTLLSSLGIVRLSSSVICSASCTNSREFKRLKA